MAETDGVEKLQTDTGSSTTINFAATHLFSLPKLGNDGRRRKRGMADTLLFIAILGETLSASFRRSWPSGKTTMDTKSETQRARHKELHKERDTKRGTQRTRHTKSETQKRDTKS